MTNTDSAIWLHALPSWHGVTSMILKLDMLSQVGAAGDGQKSKSADDDIGGRRPSGGISRQDDRDPDEKAKLRSGEFYRHQLIRVERRFTQDAHKRSQSTALFDADVQLKALEKQAEESYWVVARRTISTEPQSMADPDWKHWVRHSKEDHAAVARRFGCSREYIRQIRAGTGTQVHKLKHTDYPDQTDET